MRRNSFLTKLKLIWLDKKKTKLKSKVDTAFSTVKQEIITFINETYSTDYRQPSIFVRYLANAVQTNDVISFLKVMDGVIEDAKRCGNDPEAKEAIRVCRYIKHRINLLSFYTLLWTNVKLYCRHCGRVIRTNFLYTDKVCPYCGHIFIGDDNE